MFIELLTGLGIAFGIGMYLPLFYTLTFFVGVVSPNIWEKKLLEPKWKTNNWTEHEITLRLLDTYMTTT